MAKKDLARDPKSMDVSTPEAQFTVQCGQVSLIYSHLEPIENTTEVDVSSVLFKIEITVEMQRAFAYLHAQVAALSESPELLPCSLNFTLLGVFRAEGEMSSKALGDFARHYTLSILWPYAREYTADQLRRAGLPFETLPVINPQVVTEKLIKADLITVEINGEE